MYPSIGVVVGTIAVMASPILWVAWWLLADLSEKAGGRGHVAYVSIQSRRGLPAS